MEGRQRCHGLRFQEVEYNVVIGPKPWPWCTSIFWCLRLWVILLILLPVLNFNGYRAPRTELEALTIHDFSLTRDDTTVLTPWLVNGNFTVVYQARNPSWVVGFGHRYLSTRVSAWYYGMRLGLEIVPQFSQEYKSARNVSANVVIREQRINQRVGSMLQSEMQKWGSVWMWIDVRAYVKVKRLGWQHPKWFNFACHVKVSTPNSTDKAGNLLEKKICHWSD